MACNCRGGPNCCMRGNIQFGPYKCPDCGTWWTGSSHQCSKTSKTIPNGFGFGHCHGCSSMACLQADDVPCFFHRSGYTITINQSV